MILTNGYCTRKKIGEGTCWQHTDLSHSIGCQLLQWWDSLTIKLWCGLLQYQNFQSVITKKINNEYLNNSRYLRIIVKVTTSYAYQLSPTNEEHIFFLSLTHRCSPKVGINFHLDTSCNVPLCHFDTFYWHDIVSVIHSIPARDRLI